MNIVDVAQALGTALNGVAGLRGFPFAPTIWKAGDAWPQWGGAGHGDQGGYSRNFVHAWRILTVLPAEVQAGMEFIDEHLDAIVDAVAPFIAVSEIDYGALPAGGSQAAYQALIIIGERE